jgi:hypothetical protein
MTEIERKECEKGGVGCGGVFDVADEGAEEGGGEALKELRECSSNPADSLLR